MNLTGKNWIAGSSSGTGDNTFTAINPATGEPLQPDYHESTDDEIAQALQQAELAFEVFRLESAEKVAAFLDGIAEEIVGLGDALIARANVETALPEARLTGERARTVGQLKMFAQLVLDGSWVEARIDRAQSDRKPLPKPDLRQRLVPIGPVVVFGASNFPLAFSVAGGDTASALAAGNPVVVKAHPAHPGTSEMVGQAIQAAAKRTKMHPGVFSLLNGTSHDLSLSLVRHPLTKAVGFTGSFKAGRVLFDAAAARPEPIPVYAEMGSTNPVFVLPGALQERASAIAEGLMQSVIMGAGQFCTNPGLVFGLRDKAFEEFAAKSAQLAGAAVPGTMLYRAICERFQEGIDRARNVKDVRIAGQSGAGLKPGQAPAVVLTTTADSFTKNATLSDEIFGPSTLLVSCGTPSELERIARMLPGQLTATVHGTLEDLANYQGLLRILERKAGRLLFNGFPTGVEVCPSMHHGGPYPATTDSHFTSVGTAAIKRFVRPLCFQNFPEAALPVELRNKNTRNIWRLLDGQTTKEDA